MVYTASPELYDPEKNIKCKTQISWIQIHKIVQKVSITAWIGLDNCPAEIGIYLKNVWNW